MSENSQNTNQDIKIFQSRWIVPVSKDPIENGAIVVKNEKIVDVDTIDEIREKYSQDITDLGDAVIFPGFINAHIHLEHPDLQKIPGDYLSYQKEMHFFSRTAPNEDKIKNITQNVEDTQQYGVIAIADISSQGLSTELLLKTPLYSRIFLEIEGFKKSDAWDIFRKQQGKITSFPIKKNVTMHFGMNSLWTISPELLRQISTNERHTALHLGVTDEENNFFLNGKGTIKQYLHSIEDFDYSWEKPGVSPLKYFLNNHFYARHNILVHMTHISKEDIEHIKKHPIKINICLCPRSEENLNIGKAPLDLFQSNGLNICLGTESKALVRNLDLRADFIHCIHRYGTAPKDALKFATLNGAYAIGFHKEVGSLDPGKTSRCLLIRGSQDEMKKPLELIASPEKKVEWLE